MITLSARISWPALGKGQGSCPVHEARWSCSSREGRLEEGAARGLALEHGVGDVEGQVAEIEGLPEDNGGTSCPSCMSLREDSGTLIADDLDRVP